MATKHQCSRRLGFSMMVKHVLGLKSPSLASDHNKTGNQNHHIQAHAYFSYHLFLLLIFCFNCPFGKRILLVYIRFLIPQIQFQHETSSSIIHSTIRRRSYTPPMIPLPWLTEGVVPEDTNLQVITSKISRTNKPFSNVKLEYRVPSEMTLTSKQEDRRFSMPKRNSSRISLRRSLARIRLSRAAEHANKTKSKNAAV